MTIVVAVNLDVAETLHGQPLVRAQNAETLQTPLNALGGDMAVAVIERLIDDVKDRAVSQVREFVRQSGGQG